MLKLSEFFEVPEDVEFKIEELADTFIIQYNKLKSFSKERNCYREVTQEFNHYVGKEIEIISQKKTISEDEKVILRNLPSEFIWIARDDGNKLYCYEEKPFKGGCYWKINKGDSCEFSAFDHLFQCISWYDKEPTKIYDLLKGDCE